MRLSTAFATSSLVLSIVAEAKNGIIGYGINMYKPWCASACSDVLSSLYLECTEFMDHGHEGHSMVKRMDGMELMGMTSPECYGNSTVWLQTFSYCIKSHCDAEGLPASAQEAYWQENAAGGNVVPTLEDALPSTAPIEQLAEDAEWLNTTMLANEDTWTVDRKTIANFETAEWYHSTYSIVTLVISVALPVLAGIWILSTTALKSTLFNSIRSYFSLPALFGGRSATPLPWNIGYMPNRSTSTVIFIYIALNVIFSSVSYHSVQPSSWFSNPKQEMAAYVGNRTGVLSFANMALAILFSARNNPLLYFSGWSQNTFLALHRWAARVAIVQAIIHSIAYTADYAAYMDTNMFYTEAAKPYFWWGIIGTTAMGLMAGLSILPLRKWAYEVFLVLHIALAILSLVGCWYHISLRFSKNWGYEIWLYLAFVFWAYDRLVRFGKLVYFSFLGGTSHGQIENIPGTDNIVSLKLYPARSWTAGPGQHSFVYFPGLGKVWENHPFTIASWGTDGASSHSVSETSSTSEQDNEKGPTVSTRAVSQQPVYLDSFYVRFIFRAHTGATAKLQKGLMEKARSPTVLSEGPYGGHSPINKSILKHAENIVIVAGGIGITFAAGFVQQFVEEHSSHHRAAMPRCQKLVLAWSVRERGLLEYVRREVLPQANSSAGQKTEYRFWLTGNDAGSSEGSSLVTAGQRMNIGETLTSGLDKSKKNVVLVCGPGGMADDVRKEVVLCSKSGFDVELWEESFTW